MITYTISRNYAEIFETNDRAEAVKFFKKCKSTIAEEFDKMAHSNGFKVSDKLTYWVREVNDDPEVFFGIDTVATASYSIKDWARDFLD